MSVHLVVVEVICKFINISTIIKSVCQKIIFSQKHREKLSHSSDKYKQYSFIQVHMYNAQDKWCLILFSRSNIAIDSPNVK